MNWKNLLESVSESVNDALRLRNNYLMAENRILRNQIDGRVQLTDSERRELAELGTKLGRKTLAEIATVAKAETILAWNRQCADQQVGTSESLKSVGRPRVDKEIEDVVIRMARENRSWGYDSIQGALKPLGYTISDQTVGNILKRHSLPPAPKRKKTVTWREFVRIHMDILSVTDFFTSEVWSGLGLVSSCLLFFLSFGHCKGEGPRRITHLRQPLMGLIRLRSPKVKHHLQRWKYLVEEMMRLRPSGCDNGVRRAPPYEVIRHDRQEPLSQGRSKVVLLHAARPHPIRDGPVRRQCRLGGRRASYDREAA
jgi:hypothetical protein